MNYRFSFISLCQSGSIQRLRNMDLREVEMTCIIAGAVCLVHLGMTSFKGQGLLVALLSASAFSYFLMIELNLTLCM
jgi:hypothetical protein